MTIAEGKLKEQESMGMNSVSTVAQTLNRVVKELKVGMAGIKNRGSQIHKIKTKYSRKFKISKKYDCEEEMDENKYRPLPESVVGRVSPIHGYGLFATENIPGGKDLGVSHIFAPGFKHNHVRTPLGGFLNHSDTPNCFKLKSHEDSVLTYYNLWTTGEVKAGEELTVKYTLYDVRDGSCPAVDDNTPREELEVWKKQKENI